MKVEQNERRLAEVQAMYEKKLLELSTRITEMEAERDRVLTEMGKSSSYEYYQEKRNMKSTPSKKHRSLLGTASFTDNVVHLNVNLSQSALVSYIT